MDVSSGSKKGKRNLYDRLNRNPIGMGTQTGWGEWSNFKAALEDLIESADGPESRCTR
jgi:hypothetical protein